MNADHDYQIGKEHIVCQDYALSGVVPTDKEDGFAYAIVCDGCSSSPDVDCGARLLAMSAREFMSGILSTNLEAELFGKHCIRLAASSASRFAMLHPQAFDATLLIAIVKDKKLTAYLFGDGVFIHRSQEDAARPDIVRAIHIKLTANVPDTDIIASPPDYLSYELDQERKVRYLTTNVTKTVQDHLIQKGLLDTYTEKVRPPFAPVVIRSDLNPGDVIAVCSDGIDSFRQPNNDPIFWRDLIDEYTGFKTTAGVFVHRRIGAFKRKCKKDLITHSDDISIAAIVV